MSTAIEVEEATAAVKALKAKTRKATNVKKKLVILRRVEKMVQKARDEANESGPVASATDASEDGEVPDLFEEENGATPPPE